MTPQVSREESQGTPKGQARRAHAHTTMNLGQTQQTYVVAASMRARLRNEDI